MSLLLVLSLVACAQAVDQFIVGGAVATPGDYPWQGSLQYNGGHTCGCILIDEDWALSAAHCTHGRDVPSRFQAWFGVHDRSTNQGVKHDVTEIIEHPDYGNDVPFPNDIVALHLATSADLSDPWTDTIGMSSREVDYAYTDCRVSGWGRTCGGCSLPQEMNHTPIDVLTIAECQDLWWNYPIGDDQVCVYDKDNAELGSCNGDSGGPLTCFYSSAPEAVGIMSWMEVGCRPAWPSVYQRISVHCHSGWVQTVTGVSCL